MRIVSNPESSIAGITRFYDTIEANPNHPIVDKLTRFRAWYATKKPDGRWIFGPSKFIGYKDITPDEYVAHKGQGMDGRQTENALQKWFQEVPDGDLYDELEDALHDFLARFDKRPSNAHRISILKKGINVGDHEAAQALLTVLKSLPEGVQANFSRIYRP